MSIKKTTQSILFFMLLLSVAAILPAAMPLKTRKLQPKELPLIQAIIDGDTAQIAELLLRPETDIHKKNRMGATALFAAIYEGRTNIVDLLLAADADPNAPMPDGHTPLLLAAQLGNTKTVDRLLQEPQISIDQRNPQFKTALIYAASRGHIETTNRLLQRYNELGQLDKSINLQDTKGKTALMHAISRQHPAIVEVLLSAGASPHIKDIFRQTALVNAVATGNQTIVTRLLSCNGVDVNELCEINYRNIDTDLLRCLEIPEELYQTTETTNALIVAAQYDHLNVINQLIAAGAEINTQNNYGLTALMVATMNGNEHIIDELLKAGADATLINIEGETAANMAEKIFGIGNRIAIKLQQTLGG